MKKKSAEKQPVEQFHFYASSVTEWITTNPDLDLRKLLKQMDKRNETYNLWLVPLTHDAVYKISNYQPMVQGITFLGQYSPSI